MRQIAGVQHERRRFRVGFDLRDRRGKVAVTFVFAGLSKPMWLSLICTKRSAPVPCVIIGGRDCPSGDPPSTPLDSSPTLDECRMLCVKENR
jgi:hypothetical protein